jgi:hypothetical protein
VKRLLLDAEEKIVSRAENAYADEAIAIKPRDVHFTWDDVPLHYVCTVSRSRPTSSTSRT